MPDRPHEPLTNIALWILLLTVYIMMSWGLHNILS
jgi:hypothetical protein